MQVIILHGPAAAGKHTIGRLLSDRLGLPLFHNHLTVDLAKTLFEFGTESFRRLRAAVWQAAFAEATVARRSFIFTFHPEASVNPSLITDLVEQVTDAGGRVHFIELFCPRDTVLERLGSESRAAFGKLTDAALYLRIEAAGGFRFPPMPSPLVRVDTSATTASDAAAVIEQALRDVA